MRVHLFDKENERIGSDMGYKLQFIPDAGDPFVLGTTTYVVIERTIYISLIHEDHEVHLTLELA